MIFAFGETVQAIDMNQDGCLAESYKQRNLMAVGAATVSLFFLKTLIRFS